MSIETRSVPGLFGGISQKIPAMRDPTQAEDQENFLANTEVGLYTRPGLRTQALLAGSAYTGGTRGALAHFMEGPDGRPYVALLWSGRMELYRRDTGVPMTVLNGGPNPYLDLGGTSPEDGFAALTLGDFTFVVNRTVTCQTSPTKTPANPAHVAYVDVVSAIGEITYSVTVGGTTVNVAVPVTGPRHGPIADEITSRINTSVPGYTAARVPESNVIKISRTSLDPITVSVSDTWDTKTMRVVSDGVPTFADLPNRFEEGYVIKVVGTADNADEDAYYVHWVDGRWIETLKPDSVDRVLNAFTMPRRLRQLSSESWVLETVDWGQRLVGDEGTAPDPSFVGQTISDIFFLRNRLGFLAGDAAILSRSGEYFDFFPRTATQVLETDPIDIANPESSVRRFERALVFNQNLLIWTDGEVQMSLVGGELLTPTSARLIPASTFETDAACRPVSYGSRALFAQPAPTWAKLQSYRVSSDSLTNVADELTGHVPRLVPASPRALAASQAAGYVVALPRRAGSQELQLLRLEEDESGERFVQRCWSRLTVASGCSWGVLGAAWDNQVLYLAVAWDPPEGPTRVTVEALDPRHDSVDPETGLSLCLDRRMPLTGGLYNAALDQTTYTVQAVDPGFVVARVVPGGEPMLLEATITPSGGATSIVVPGGPRADLWVGVPMRSTYEFTRAILRDGNGAPLMESSLKLLHYVVRYEGSGRARVVVSLPNRADTWVDFGGPVQGLWTPGAGPQRSSGQVKATVQGHGDKARVRIVAEGLLPVVVPYAEWVAAVQVKARR